MLNKFLRSQKGAVISIEFAVIVPMFLLLIFLFIEFCRLLFISSVLDMITVEASYFIAKENDVGSIPATGYSQLFYDKVAKDMPLWPLVTSGNNLEVNIAYCSLVDDAIKYIDSSGGNCYTSPLSNSLAVFNVKYHYSPMFTASTMFESLESILERKVVVFKEY